MKKIELKRTVVGSALSLGLVVGMAGFAAAAPGINATTGPDSTNTVKQKTTSKVHVKNDNKIQATNNNDQYAMTGDASATHNTRAGDARTGSAANANALNASVAVDNSSSSASDLVMSMPSGSPTISGTTGPDSTNRVEVVTKSDVQVTNTNNLNVQNNNSQTATSGNAMVNGNTTGGSATSGNASNTNSTTLSFKVTN